MSRVPLHPGILALDALIRVVIHRKEQIVADFTQFQQNMDGLLAAIVAETEQVSALLADTSDQAAVDAAAARLQEFTAAIKAMVPDTPPTTP